MTLANGSDNRPAEEGDVRPAAPETRSRRDVVRSGVKLAFVAPVLSTFFAKDAYAASYSCYPPGHICGGPNHEPCCTGVCNFGNCPFW